MFVKTNRWLIGRPLKGSIYGVSASNQRILYYGNTAGYVDKGKAMLIPCSIAKN